MDSIKSEQAYHLRGLTVVKLKYINKSRDSGFY